MSEQEPQGLLGFLQAELRALRIDLGGRMDRFQEQNSKEHKEVREAIGDVGSEVRQASSKASRALEMAEQIAADVGAHLEAHKERDDREDGAREERNKVLGPIKEGVKELPKALIVGGAAAAGFVIRSLT